MMPRARYRAWLLRFLDGTEKAGWRSLLFWFSVVASVSSSLYGQQTNSYASQAPSSEVVHEAQTQIVNPPALDNVESEVNSGSALQPAWVISTDSEGNIRQRYKLSSDFAVGDHARLGILFGQGFISNSSQPRESDDIRDLAITTQWRPDSPFQFEGMAGVSQVAATRDVEGRPVGQRLIPITKLMGHLKPAGSVLRLDFGFERSIFDLSPMLVANRVVRNQFTMHPELAFADGWRIRALAEVGPITTPTESNARYNSEFTLGHKLGKGSEVYSTYGLLHYAHASDAGYFPPDMVNNLQGGWTSDIDHGPFSLTLDLALGAGRSREHGAAFGPWGISGYVGSYLTWTVHDRSEVTASYEFSYDKSSPALQPSTGGDWHMNAVTLAFRWATK